MKKFLRLLPLLLLLGCTQTSKEPKSPNVLRINFQDGDLPSTHPHIGIDYRMRSLQSALFEGLTRMEPDGKPALAAAETVSISESQTRYTFTLRSLCWSNCQPVTAEHFANAWKQAIAKDSPCRRSDLFYIIKNCEKIKKGELDLESACIKALDERTLEIELEHPAPYFLELISNPIFSPLFDNSEEPTIYNGPFLIDSWEHEKSIVLKKNPLYWDQNSVGLDKIEISVVTDPLTTVSLFEKNEIDWIGSPFSTIPTDMIPAFQKTGNLITKEVARVYWLYCNTDVPPFSNASIRKALSYALNRQEIVDHVLLGQAPATKPLPQSLSLFMEAEIPATLNQERAQQLFAQGLQELGLTPESFPPISLSHSHISGQKQLAEIIQSNWQQVLGVKVRIEGSEWNVYFDNLSRGNFQVGGCLKSALFKDPVYHLELLENKHHPYNVSRWEDTHYQELLHQARFCSDPLSREKLLRGAEEILVDQMPVIPIYSETYLYMIRPHIQNVIIHDLGHVDFKWASVSPQ